jgi:predicted ABC-type ATPase
MPNVIAIAGPNGAGKSTVAPGLLRDLLGIDEFVNADVVARGLSGFDPESAAIQAGRIMLQRLRQLAQQRADFAFETTLASRVFAPWIAGLAESGYLFRLVYLWVESAELCIARIAERVRTGGHDIPDDVVRRRYSAGLRNFFELYRPLAETWQVYDNSSGPPVRLVAEGHHDHISAVYDESIWSSVTRGLRDADQGQA